jgi:hypothetical protein
MARYVAALLGGGTNEHGSVVNPETLASMYAPYMQSDPRVPGMGLSFELGEEGGHRTAAKGGVLSGFLSQMTLAPDDGIGILAFANTGGLDGRGAAEPLALALVRHLLELPADAIRTDIPARPEDWSGICGWYGMEPGPLTNLFDRLLFGAGAEVMVRHGHLLLRPLTPIPALRTGFRLHPDEADDPYVFRIDFSGLGKGTFRVAFSRGAGDGTAGVRLHGLGMQLRKRPDALNPRLWANGALTAFATALAVHRRGMRARRRADARYLSP